MNIVPKTKLQFKAGKNDFGTEFVNNTVTVEEICDDVVIYVGETVDGEEVEGDIRMCDVEDVFTILSVEYELNHITDLLKIPGDRLNAALDEMKIMLPLMRATFEAEKAVRRDRGLSNDDGLAERCFPTVTWLDDGSLTNEVTINGEPAIKVEVKKA